MHCAAKEIAIVLTLWCAVYCNYVCYSVIAPFFPQLATKKGLLPIQYSFVFAGYSMSQVTVTFFVGKFLNVVGPKFVVVLSLLLTGIATFAFGFMEFCPNEYFFAVSSLIRMIEGAGFSAFFTATLTILAITFPSNAGYYVGLTETVVTIGMITGPPIGSLLYAAGGFKLPLFTFGALITALTVISVFTVQISEVNQNFSANSVTTKEYIRLLRLPATILAMTCVTLNVITDSFLLITLSSHLQIFELTPQIIGAIFMCLFLSYGISSPISGRLSDKRNIEYTLQAIGSLVMVIAFVLIGPLISVPKSVKLAVIITGLFCKGLGAGPLISCSYTACLKAVIQHNRNTPDSRTFTMVSTVVSFSIPLGNLLGGSTAGVMFEELGMRKCCVIYAVIFLLLAAVCIFRLASNSDDSQFSYSQSIDANVEGAHSSSTKFTQKQSYNSID